MGGSDTEERIEGAGWSRRRFLRRAGLAGLGTVSALAAVRLAWSAVVEPAAASPSPGATATPRPSASAGPDLSGLRLHFRSRPDLTPPVVVVERLADPAVAPGYLFFTPSNGAGPDGPMIVDDDGIPVWVRPGNGRSAANLQAVEFRGKPALLWWEGSVNGGIGTGEVVVVDASYQEVARLQVGHGYRADLHECQLTPQGTALMTGDGGVAIGRVAGGQGRTGQVMDCGVWEIDLETGDVVFEWHGVDHVGIDESFISQPTDGSIWDYLHVNSIELDRDGGLLVSARNTSTVYKIDRRTGEVVWRLGGKRGDFALDPGAAFSWQHDARRHADGTISIFDDSADPGTSRAIVLALDEAAKRARLLRSYARTPPVLAKSQGNAQLLPNGNVLVGWGDAPFWSEFSADGRLLLDATYPAARQSYRVLRFPWAGQPSEPPAVAAHRVSGGTAVYASWNGATAVAGWDVLGGSTASALARVGSAPRSGFETTIHLATRPALVAVRALDAAGRVLASSSPVAVTGA